MTQPTYQQQGYGQPQPQQNPSWPPAPPQAQQQNYAPPQQQGYYQQQNYAPPQQTAPQQPAHQGSLEEYASQPASGGKLFINGIVLPQPGSRIQVRVQRDLRDTDTEHMKFRGTLLYHNDGRPKLQLNVPVYVHHQGVPSGEGILRVHGQMEEALTDAMVAAGVAYESGAKRPGVPEGGSTLDITRDNDNFLRSGARQFVFRVHYTRPEHAANGQVQQQAQQMVQPPMDGHAGMKQYVPEMQHAQQQPPWQEQQQSSAQPQWPAEGAPLSTPPQPAPPGTNPYDNPALPPNRPDTVQQAPPQPAPQPVDPTAGAYPAPSPAPAGVPGAQPQTAPPPPSSPPPPQPYGMQPPAQQVASATQAATQAAQQHQAPPPAAPGRPAGLTDEQWETMKSIMGQTQ